MAFKKHFKVLLPAAMLLAQILGSVFTSLLSFATTSLASVTRSTVVGAITLFLTMQIAACTAPLINRKFEKGGYIQKIWNTAEVMLVQIVIAAYFIPRFYTLCTGPDYPNWLEDTFVLFFHVAASTSYALGMVIQIIIYAVLYRRQKRQATVTVGQLPQEPSVGAELVKPPVICETKLPETKRRFHALPSLAIFVAPLISCIYGMLVYTWIVPDHIIFDRRVGEKIAAWDYFQFALALILTFFTVTCVPPLINQWLEKGDYIQKIINLLPALAIQGVAAAYLVPHFCSIYSEMMYYGSGFLYNSLYLEATALFSPMLLTAMNTLGMLIQIIIYAILNHRKNRRAALIQSQPTPPIKP